MLMYFLSFSKGTFIKSDLKIECFPNQISFNSNYFNS